MAYVAQHSVEVEELAPGEGLEMLDQQARERLGISGVEFLDRLDRDDFDGFDHRAVIDVSMLLPFVR